MTTEYQSGSAASHEPPPLPEMRDAVLTVEEVHALASDLDALTRISGILEKGVSTSRAEASTPSLNDALTRLTNGHVRAIQIRYQYDRHEWTDTLMAVPHGFRLVRCRHES